MKGSQVQLGETQEELRFQTEQSVVEHSKTVINLPPVGSCEMFHQQARRLPLSFEKILTNCGEWILPEHVKPRATDFVSECIS